MTRRRLIATRTPEADGSFGAAGAWRQAVKATRFVHSPCAGCDILGRGGIENGREQTPRCRFMPYTFDRTRVS